MMPDPFDTGEIYTRRRHPRIAGPFDGRRGELLPVPLQIHDLSLGGCLIQSHYHQAPGRRFTMDIEFPVEGWIQVEAESLDVREGHGFAVRFVAMSDDARQRLKWALSSLVASRTAR